MKRMVLWSLLVFTGFRAWADMAPMVSERIKITYLHPALMLFLTGTFVLMIFTVGLYMWKQVRAFRYGKWFFILWNIILAVPFFWYLMGLVHSFFASDTVPQGFGFESSVMAIQTETYTVFIAVILVWLIFPFDWVVVNLCRRKWKAALNLFLLLSSLSLLGFVPYARLMYLITHPQKQEVREVIPGGHPRPPWKDRNVKHTTDFSDEGRNLE